MRASTEQPIGSATSLSGWSAGTRSIALWALVTRNWRSIMWHCGWWLASTRPSIAYSQIEDRRHTHTPSGVRLTNEKQSLVVRVRESRTHGEGGQVDRNLRARWATCPWPNSSRLPGAGEPDALKGASPVRRGAAETGP